ncbi:MAG: (Fe-S)-binding protein, partial [Sedimenticola sp.]|nr:(Fe-S)-binding protein [Sedimenticola sp.]
MHQTAEFHKRVKNALDNPQLRNNFRVAMDGLMEKRSNAFPDKKFLEELRITGSKLRANALVKQADLLEQLEANCTRNGIQVHRAETVEEANHIVLGIMDSHN